MYTVSMYKNVKLHMHVLFTYAAYVVKVENTDFLDGAIPYSLSWLLLRWEGNGTQAANKGDFNFIHKVSFLLFKKSEANLTKC